MLRKSKKFVPPASYKNELNSSFSSQSASQAVGASKPSGKIRKLGLRKQNKSNSIITQVSQVTNNSEAKDKRGNEVLEDSEKTFVKPEESINDESENKKKSETEVNDTLEEVKNATTKRESEKEADVCLGGFTNLNSDSVKDELLDNAIENIINASSIPPVALNGEEKDIDDLDRKESNQLFDTISARISNETCPPIDLLDLDTQDILEDSPILTGFTHIDPKQITLKLPNKHTTNALNKDSETKENSEKFNKKATKETRKPSLFARKTISPTESSSVWERGVKNGRQSQKKSVRDDFSDFPSSPVISSAGKLTQRNKATPKEKPHAQSTKTSKTSEFALPKLLNRSRKFEDTQTTISDFYQPSSEGIGFSQPPKAFGHKQRLEWLQERRGNGVWVQCDREACQKWRYLEDTQDPSMIVGNWYCHMHPDPKYNSCEAEEVGPSPLEEEDMVYNRYTAGSVVWAKLDGYPWWPGMVDDCPDTEQYYWLNNFSDIPLWYNVTFFDKKLPSRAWITPQNLMPYQYNINVYYKMQKKHPYGSDYSTRLAIAKQIADKAVNMNVKERLKQFSFLATWPKPIRSPPRVGPSKHNNAANTNNKPKKRKQNENENKENKNVHSQDVINGKAEKQKKIKSKETHFFISQNVDKNVDEFSFNLENDSEASSQSS